MTSLVDIDKQNEAAHNVAASSPKVNGETTNHAAGYEAQGWALAQSVLAENMHQLQARGVWHRYVAKLVDFGTEARGFFIKALNADTKARREHVKAQEGTDMHDIFRKANASAQVQISNLGAIARAMNKGFRVECAVTEEGQFKRDGQNNLIPVQAFSTILAQAQKFLAQNSEGQKKGRPALSFEAQLAKWFASTAKVNTKEDQEAYEKAMDLLTKANILHISQGETE